MLDRTLTVTLIPTLRPTSTLTVLRQRLYRTSEAPETIARILQPYNIHVAHKPITTLRRLLINVKGKDKPEDRQGEVNKIKINAATTKLLTLVKLAETLACD